MTRISCAAGLAGVLLLLAACTTPPAPVAPTPAVTPTPGPTPAPAPEAHVRFVPASWKELPAVDDALLAKGLESWRRACSKARHDAVKAACALPPSNPRQFVEQHFLPYRIVNDDGSNHGLITGYYEPVYRGSRHQTASATVPVLGTPPDLVSVELATLYPELKGKRLRGRVEGNKLVPYADARDIRAGKASAPVLAWLEKPIDLQFLQIQGSGRVRLDDGSEVRLGYAQQNGHPYRPVGRWLIEQGLVAKEDMSMQAIRQWAEQNPARVAELLDSNPSYVFFRELPPSSDGPVGSMGTPLMAGYAVAVDPAAIPLGSLIWLETTDTAGQPLQRLVAAQDTGGAIRGQVRADLFTGTGDAAGEVAGKMAQRGHMWLIWPKDAPPPAEQ
ncbi:murein transglycosylase A [Chitinibacteraceae bacterium HSL-7]